MPRPASFCDLCVPCYDLAEVGIPSGPAAEARALCVKRGGVEEGTCDACGIVRPTIIGHAGHGRTGAEAHVSFCVECGRAVHVPVRLGARPVCDSHVAAGRLLGRRSESTLRILAARHALGDVAMIDVVPAPPASERSWT